MSKIVLSALVLAFVVLLSGIISPNWQWLLIIALIPFIYAAYQHLSNSSNYKNETGEISLTGYKGGKAYREGILDTYEDEEE